MRDFRCMAAVLVACGSLVLGGCAHLPGTGPDEGRTVVYRDTWGIPHIYAPTPRAGAYAMGWAQAHDRPEQLLLNYLRGIGEAASVEGPSALQSDMVAHYWDNYGVARRNAERISPEIRDHIQEFVRGVNDYYSYHPQDRPVWWGDRQVDEYMVIAFGRFFLNSWSIEDAFQDLARGGIEPGQARAGRGSNQIAISPARSSEGAAILVIDPHLSWWGPSRFWEFRIHAGAFVGSGVTLPGFPAIGLGHNRDLAWAMTTGGPDTADIYELKINPENSAQYLYDGEWKSFTSRKVTLRIKDGEDQTVTIDQSHLGPVVASREGRAYAARMAYADEVEVIEAWYNFIYGNDYRDAIRAMDSLQIFPQNVMVADTSGNIYYQRTGRVPVRPEGYDWSKPVDGTTSATNWQGLHPAAHHLQVLNPPQGAMQNCNIPPDAMMPDSPFSPENAPSYIYSDLSHGPLSGWTNQRGARAVEMIEDDPSISAKDARAMILDVQPYGSDRWIDALVAADEVHRSSLRRNADYLQGLKDLRAWDRRLAADSTGALKYVYWRDEIARELPEEALEALMERIDHYRVALGGPRRALDLGEDDLRQLALTFASAMTRMRTERGSLNGVYGDVFRVGRDEKSWPVGGGGDHKLGLTTLRNVGYGEPREDGTRWGRSGQTSTQVVVLSRPIQSWTALPIGQSDRADSPHYADQAEKLFSPGDMKPTWWLPTELREHIDSREVLEDAP